LGQSLFEQGRRGKARRFAALNFVLIEAEQFPRIFNLVGTIQRALVLCRPLIGTPATWVDRSSNRGDAWHASNLGGGKAIAAFHFILIKVGDEPRNCAQTRECVLKQWHKEIKFVNGGCSWIP
jgi:hypothetical protein